MENIETYIFIFMFFIVLIIIIYIYSVNTLLQSNCDRIGEYSKNDDDTRIFTEEGINPIFDVTLNKVFVKTAYNCCCTGRFKNDYVSLCALNNCKKQGVRALHFEIYNLNGRPIIATASINRPNYKEMYNYLDFSETMTHISTTFMGINEEPLFLILEINSDLSETYKSVYNSLTNIFKENIYNVGTSSPENINLKLLRGKVCILISFKINNYKYYTVDTSLNAISYNMNDKIMTYTSFIGGMTDFNNITNFTEDQQANIRTIKLLVSNKQDYTKNFDFISSGIKYGITFTAMNFQFNDSYLKEYNNMFKQATNPVSTSSFALKYGIIGTTYYSPIINAMTPNNSTITNPVTDINLFNKLAISFT